MNDLKESERSEGSAVTMPAAAEKTNLASLKRPGDKGTIKKRPAAASSSRSSSSRSSTRSGRSCGQLGSCDTAEEAAEKLAECLATFLYRSMNSIIDL